jgi:hypothetical protein
VWTELVGDQDPWGHPIVYRRPGPLHPRGWDIYSFGPDGEDDGGRGDDIVIGEDDDAPITVTPRDTIYFPGVEDTAIVSTVTPAARGP